MVQQLRVIVSLAVSTIIHLSVFLDYSDITPLISLISEPMPLSPIFNLLSLAVADEKQRIEFYCTTLVNPRNKVINPRNAAPGCNVKNTRL